MCVNTFCYCYWFEKNTENPRSWSKRQLWSFKQRTWPITYQGICAALLAEPLSALRWVWAWCAQTFPQLLIHPASVVEKLFTTYVCVYTLNSLWRQNINKAFTLLKVYIKTKYILTYLDKMGKTHEEVSLVLISTDEEIRHRRIQSQRVDW